MTLRYAALIGLVGLTTHSALAQQCEEKDLVVAFSNGMFNELYDAYQGMLALKTRLGPRVNEYNADGVDYEVEFILSYNQSEAWWRQIIQVGDQRDHDEWGAFIREVQSGGGPTWMQEAANELQAEAQEETWVVDSDLQRHVQRYRNEILEGKKVLVASHSQGNFYANAAYAAVGSASLGIVGAAVPASMIAGGGPYVTLGRDRVMNAVRSLYPTTLPANADNYSSTSSGHEFVTDYLDGEPSGRYLMEGYLNQIRDIEEPETDAGDGIFTVTLEWGGQPDVDLHVFEPDGSHVYYSAPAGTAGYLDVDDTSGSGPEHYYASCERLLAGTYRVGVNYYRGDGPETARVQIEAGDAVRNFTQPLGADVGSDGNDSPIPVATVVVSGSEEDGFEFEIRGGGPALRDPLGDLLGTPKGAIPF